MQPGQALACTLRLKKGSQPGLPVELSDLQIAQRRRGREAAKLVQRVCQSLLRILHPIQKNGSAAEQRQVILADDELAGLGSETHRLDEDQAREVQTERCWGNRLSASRIRPKSRESCELSHRATRALVPLGSRRHLTTTHVYQWIRISD